MRKRGGFLVREGREGKAAVKRAGKKSKGTAMLVIYLKYRVIV